MKSSESIETPATTSDDARPNKIVFVIPVPLETVYAETALLQQWIQYTVTQQTSLFLLVQRPKLDNPMRLALPWQPRDITLRLRAICEPTGAACYVRYEKQDRILICVLSPSVITGLQKPLLLLSGPASSYESPPPSGPV